MRKLIITVAMLATIMIAAIVLFKSALSKNEGYKAAKTLLINDKDNRIDDSYLKIFQKIKTLDPEITKKLIKTMGTQQAIRDPFALPKLNSNSTEKAAAKKIRAPHLGGILWAKQVPSAVIGGQIVQVGDIIGGYRVIRISHNKVQLRSTKGDLLLKLPKIE